MKFYIGIDNGTSGTIGFRSATYSAIIETPMHMEQSYTKKEKRISRISRAELLDAIKSCYANACKAEGVESMEMLAVIERPMINPSRFVASVSAARSIEATLCVLEDNGIPLMYVDSRDWQPKILPRGAKGDALKTASHDIGIRLFPLHKATIDHHKDADGLLIAEVARREGW